MREEEVCLVKEKAFNSKSIASFTCGLDLYGGVCNIYVKQNITGQLKIVMLPNIFEKKRL